MTRSLLARVAAAGAAAALLLTAAPATAAPVAATAGPTDGHTSERTPTNVERIPGAVDPSTAADTFGGSNAAFAFAPCAYDFADAPPAGSFYTAITWMACEGITAGYSDHTFGKGKHITRGEVAQFMYRMSGQTHKPGTQRDFEDVNPGGAGFTAISWLKEEGITTGYADRRFGPSDPISRGELAQFLYLFSGETYQHPAAEMFTDVTRGGAFSNAAAWLKSTHLVSGYADGTFRRGKDISRGEASQFLYALESYLNGTPAAPATAPKPYPRQAAPVSTVSLWTTVTTGIYEHGSYGSKKLATLPAQARVAKLGSSGSMTKVKHGTTSGWVNSYFLSAGQPGGLAVPHSSPKTYAQQVENHIARWCWGVPVTTGPGTHGWATMQAFGTGDDQVVEELIFVGSDHPATSDVSKAVQIHECAHILQYRAYKYEPEDMESAMERIYPNGQYEGAEHMADCMADVMGAKRRGTFAQDGHLYSYEAGYGGTCSTAQLEAARKLVAGQRV
ncbi:MAG: S-layer homology domain-containing protein [Micrococcus sp.]|nr:S-layer homology domain-containing protein [Micrococcus sp.]